MDILKKWGNFSDKVTAFSHCDGFAAIHTAASSETGLPGILEEGWVHYPPHKHLRIEKDGSLSDITEDTLKENAEFEKMTREEYREKIQKDAMHEYEADEPMFVVECRAGMVTVDSEYKVRTGFWTRVECFEIEKGIELTIKLWEEESQLEDKEKAHEEFKTTYVNELKHAMAKMRNKDSIEPLIDTIEFHEEVRPESNFVDNIPPRQVWWIAKFVNDLEKDIDKLNKLMKGKLQDPELVAFLQKLEDHREATRQANLDGNNNLISMDQFFEAFEVEGNMVEDFLKNWKAI